MSELEAKSLLNIFSTLPSSAADDRDGHMREYNARVAQILSSVHDDLNQLNQFFLKIIQKFLHDYTADVSIFQSHPIKDGFLKECEPHGIAFRRPRIILERLAAKTLIYRPIKLPDYTTDDVFILQDFANEYRLEIQRQFSVLEEVDSDIKEFIAIFSGNVEQFLDAEMAKFQKYAHNGKSGALCIFVESVNKFAFQRFEFYREVNVYVGGRQPTAQSRLEQHFKAAVGVLEKKKDEKFSFPLFGCSRMVHLISIIEGNKKKLLGHANAGPTSQNLPIAAAYRMVYEQILFAVSSISII